MFHKQPLDNDGKCQMCFEAHLKGREEGGDGWREGERKQRKEKGREERERIVSNMEG